MAAFASRLDFSRSWTTCAREECIGNAPQFLSDAGWRKHKIDTACGYRVSRHRVEIGGLILSKGNSALFLDCAQPERPVRGCTRKNDPNGTGLLISSERLEKKINRAQGRDRLGTGVELQESRDDGQDSVWWDDIDVVGLDR